MLLRTKFFILGLFLCITGFLLTLVSISITAYNYQHGNDSYLRFERTMIELTAQLCIICGFIPIYYDVITNLKKAGEW